MQLVSEKNMQDGVTDTSTDDDAHKCSKMLQEPKHVSIDFADISSRYHDVCPLGCGANALIFSAIDQQCQRRLAIKKVALTQCTSPVALKRLFREIRVLRHLDHDNIMKIHHTLISARGRSNSSNAHLSSSENNQPPIDAVYIGLELMDTDLHNVLMQQKLTASYSKLFTYQLFRGLKYIHSANVIHRDLTPSNIFINMDTLMLKIGDFGVSRIFDDDYDHSGHLSMATSTTRYQAPELLLHPRHYDKSVDVWACGCIVAEMIAGQPLFNGESAFDQMNDVINSLPVTSQSWLSVASARCTDVTCCPESQAYGMRENGGCPKQPLADRLLDATAIGLDFLHQSLAFDPYERASAADLLSHPYLSIYGQNSDEPDCQHPFRVEDELDDYSYDKYQLLLSRESSKGVSGELNYHMNWDQVPPSREPSSTSLCAKDSYKNLIALVHSNNQSNSSNHSGVITESEARTIACDLDYGVQITDGSVNRERLCLDFHPIQSTSECFDPYKWDHNGNKEKEREEKLKAVKSDSVIDSHHFTSHSDHGYHSSYCSSNISHSRTHPHSMWSLSSPDISIDHDPRHGANHRASTPEAGELHLSSTHNDCEGAPPESRHSPNLSSDDKANDHSDARRRHKDDAPRHHHSYYHHHHYHHHHHHHHHHKHHRRHAASQQSQKSNEGDVLTPSSGRCIQRRCVVNEVVPEVVEENSACSSDKDANSTSGSTVPNDKEISQPNIPKTEQKADLIKQEAPSEHLKIDEIHDKKITNAALTKQSAPITEELFAKRSAMLVSGKYRSRTMSDGSQKETDKDGIVSTIQNSLSQFCLESLLKSQLASTVNCNSFSSIFQPLARGSDHTFLQNIHESVPIVPNDSLFFPSVPTKCSSTHPKPSEPHQKQVECPF